MATDTKAGIDVHIPTGGILISADTTARTQPNPSVSVPTLPTKEVDKETLMEAGRKIEKCWTSYRNRQMFQLLKTAICAAEHSLTHEILRKVAPKEATFFKDDPAVQLKIKFRFGGAQFPPNVYFKIYFDGDNCKSKYVNGKGAINISTGAAEDALLRMGHRKYYNLMIQDMIHQETHKITDISDVCTLKDYMHYLSVIDETPAEMGGKSNSWRRLGLDVLPRQTIFYDIVDFLASHQITSRLRVVLPRLITRPADPDALREQIRLITEFHQADSPTLRPRAPPIDSGYTPGRRSKQAKKRAQKMRRAYMKDELYGRDKTQLEDSAPYDSTTSATSDLAEEEEEWEEEASMLYQWTRDLTLDELVPSPRLASTISGADASHRV